MKIWMKNQLNKKEKNIEPIDMTIREMQNLFLHKENANQYHRKNVIIFGADEKRL